MFALKMHIHKNSPNSISLCKIPEPNSPMPNASCLIVPIPNHYSENSFYTRLPLSQIILNATHYTINTRL